jgi:hypothetical protein
MTMLLNILERVATEIEARAAWYDEAGIYPEDDIETLREVGLLRTFARAVEPDAVPLLNVLRTLGRTNLSVGRIFEGHVNGAKLVSWYGSAAQQAQLADDVFAGHVLSVWATEASPGVILRREGAGCVSMAQRHLRRARDAEQQILKRFLKW